MSIGFWQPRPGWLLVSPITTEEKFAGGAIILPQQARDRLSRWQAEVVASGGPAPVEGKEKPGIPHNWAPGDWVVFPPRSAMNVDEEGIILLDEKLAWAVVSEGRTVSPESRC